MDLCDEFLIKILSFSNTHSFLGSPLIVLQQQKKIAEELNRVIKAMNNGGDHYSTPTRNSNSTSEFSSMMGEQSTAPLDAPLNMQISTKNLMINSLNSAGSDMEDSVTGDSTSDLHTER